MKKILVIAALIVVIDASAQQYDLKLNLKKGQHYTQAMAMNMNLTQSIAGQEMNIVTVMHFDFNEVVTAINAKGDFVIESQYTHMTMDLDAMGQKMNYDSNVKDTSEDNLMKSYAAALDQMMGKKFTVTITPKGKVTEVKGLKEVLAGVLKKYKDPTTKKILEETFDEKKIASNYESSYNIFPDKPVNIGDSWTKTTKVESVFPIEINTNYTLKEVSNGSAKLASTGDFTMKKDDAEINGITMKTNLKGTYNGTYQMDINTGISTSSNINMPVSGTMEVMGMSFPVSATTTVTSSTKNIE